MIKILALVDKKGFLGSADIAMAIDGLYNLNIEYTIDTFETYDLYSKDFDFKEYDLVLGGVRESRMILHKLNSSFFDKEVDTYPNELKQFLGRDVQKVKLAEVYEKAFAKEQFFVKPVLPKLFPATVVKSHDDVITFLNIDESKDAYISDLVEFKTEWRSYIHKGKIEGLHFYYGDWKIRPEIDIIQKMIKEFKNAPVSYTLDVGIINGKTCLVEANDFYAIGNYGLDFATYTTMLIDRWNELKRTK